MFTLPINQFPFEVLQRVFLHSLTFDDEDGLPVVEMDLHQPPLLLTQVCKKWSYIAHLFPDLWKRIHISIPSVTSPADQYILKGHFAAVQKWLRCAANRPLTILFDDSSPYSSRHPCTIPPEVLSGYLNLVLAVSPQWEDIEIMIPHIPAAMLSTLTHTNVPLLKKFKYVPATVPDEDIDSYPWQFLHRAPLLQSLHFCGVYWPTLHAELLQLPLHQLSSLIVDDARNWFLPRHFIYSVLYNCSQLTELQWRFSPQHKAVGEDGWTECTDGPLAVTLPNLRILTLDIPKTHAGGISTFDVLGTLELPQLHDLTLTIRAPLKNSSAPPDQVECLRRNLARVETLAFEISPFAFTGEHFRLLCQHTSSLLPLRPKLQDLTVYFDDSKLELTRVDWKLVENVGEDILGMFQATLSKEPLCPQLRKLWLHNFFNALCGTPSLPRMLAPFIDLRINPPNGVSRIEQVDITNTWIGYDEDDGIDVDSPEFDYVDQILQRWEDAGIRVRHVFSK